MHQMITPGQNLMKTTPTFLHYLVSHEDGKVIAHCLDYDLVAAADDQQEAIERLGFIVRSHVETAARYSNGMTLDHKAPQSFWKCFEEMPGNEILTVEMKQSGVEARFNAGSLIAQVVHCEPAYAIQ